MAKDVLAVLATLVGVERLFNMARNVCVVPPPQESMDNSPSLFDYGLDDLYDDLIDDFDPYLEYGKGY